MPTYRETIKFEPNSFRNVLDYLNTLVGMRAGTTDDGFEYSGDVQIIKVVGKEGNPFTLFLYDVNREVVGKLEQMAGDKIRPRIN